MIYLPNYINNIIYDYDPTFKLFIWKKIMNDIITSPVHCDCNSIIFMNIIKYKKYIKYICPYCFLDWYV